jgi:hypothetical protein
MFLWQLPQNIVALLMMPFLGKLRLVKYDNYCWAFEGEKMSGGISLGCFIFLSSFSAEDKETILHEYGHVVDSHKFGWLYLFIIGIPSFLWATFFSHGKCYYSFFTESRANKNAGLKVAKNQYGCYTYIPKEKTNNGETD